MPEELRRLQGGGGGGGGARLQRVGVDYRDLSLSEVCHPPVLAELFPRLLQHAGIVELIEQLICMSAQLCAKWTDTTNCKTGSRLSDGYLDR